MSMTGASRAQPGDRPPAFHHRINETLCAAYAHREDAKEKKFCGWRSGIAHKPDLFFTFSGIEGTDKFTGIFI
jgi:hypothetical protein